MALNYYNPADLVQHDATFNYITRTGVGFGILPSNEQVFLTARMVQDNNLNLGDAIRVWAVDNFASPETAHFASRWRAVRVQVLQRIEDVLQPSLPATVPTTAPTGPNYIEAMDTLMDTRRPWTINELTHAVAKVIHPQTPMPDLIQKVGTRLATLHRHGQIACVKVYGTGESERASAVYFAKDVDVFYEHLDTPLSEEE